MAIVFWKPLSEQGLLKTARKVFDDIIEQDDQVDKYHLQPFFSKSINSQTKILFVSDLPNFFQDQKSLLKKIQSFIHFFTNSFSTQHYDVFFSIRHSSQLESVREVFPTALNNIDILYEEMKPPDPPPWKPTLISCLPMSSMGSSAQNNPFPATSPIKPSLLQIFWPKCFQEADLIISVNPFTTSNIFTTHGSFASLFFSLPISSKSMVLVQPAEQKRVHLFTEYLRPLLNKLSYSLLFYEEKKEEEGFLILSNDYLSCDTYASALCGFKALKIPLHRHIHQKKMGLGDITKINLIGPSFKKPLHDLSLTKKSKPWNHLDWLSKKCIHCMQCINACPVTSWKKINNTYQWQSSKCIKCGYCIDLCPVCAIQINY